MAKLNLNAKEVLAEIRSLIAQLEAVKKASKGMASTTEANFKAMEGSIGNIRNKVQLLANQMNYLKAILRQQKTAVNSTTNSVDKNTSSTKKNTRAQKDNAGATGKSASNFSKLNISIKSILKGAGILEIARQIQALAENIFETTKTFDSLSFTLKAITQDTFDYENTQRYLLRITKAYGVELITTTTRWSRFLAAAKESGLSLRETENIFESMTKASATLGLKTDELTSVYLALEQMLSKGKITTEELRRQLGERLPGAMGIMAAAIGVTIPELDAMLKKGEVLSAEVLPDFAKAVERAYGIEQAERIETLVAKQNRLSAAWQTFIKNITEGDSVIKKVFGRFIDLLTETTTSFDWLFSSDDQKLRVDIAVNEDNFKRQLESSTDRYIDMKSEVERQSIKLNLDEKNFKKQLKTATGEERKIILESLDEIARIRAEKAKESEKRQIEIAKEGLDESYANYIAAEDEYQKIRDDYEAVKRGDKINAVFSQEELDEARDNFILATAEYNTFRKLVEESDVTVIPDDTPEKTQRTLRRIKDYWLETMNEILKGVKDANDEIANDETLDLRVRIDAIKKAAQTETTILRNEYKIQVRDIEDKLESEIESIEKSVEKGRLARGKANKQIEALEQEKVDHIRLLNTELSNDIIDLNRKTSKEIGDLTIDVTSQQRIDNTEDLFNQRVIAAKKAYNESKKTVEDEKRLEAELTKAARESANAIIDIKISLLRDEIAILEASGDANGEYIRRLKQQINELEASKATAPVDTKDWRQVFDDALDLAKDFTDSVGGLFDAVFNRRIENINAEIQAEEEKYDRLIALAEDNEEQQKTLERNRDDRIKKLERERLKEEQKQAKARKKFALADIAISTAKAIMGIWADFPKADFGATAAIMSGVVAALGAAQAAAVLATPIPQYKEGVSNLSEDQVAMINDGSFKEYIERNNRILSTTKKNAIVELKKGDTVYKNYNDMAANSPLFNTDYLAASVKYDNDRFLEDITDSVMKGISKAKIKNNINLNANIKNNSYKESLSRWV